MYSYDAAESNELSFKEGDRIHSIEEASEDWWSGQGPDGTEGLFPGSSLAHLSSIFAAMWMLT